MSFFLGIATLSSIFIVLLVFRTRLNRLILKIPLPRIVLYILTTIPLIIIEEDINCMQSWCGTVFIPPTLPFLLIELLAVYGLYQWLRPKNIWPLVIGYCAFGIAWELILGGLKGAMLNPLFFAFMVFWVGVSYAFVSITPLTLLREKK